MGGLLQMEPALIFSDPQKTFIGQQYNSILDEMSLYDECWNNKITENEN